MKSLEISDIPLFQGLNQTALSAVKKCLTERQYQKGEVVFSEGMSCQRVLFVKSGRIKTYRISETGREQTLETLGPGDTCACNPGTKEWACNASAEAVTSSIVWHLSRDEYIHLVKDNYEAAQSLNSLFANRLQCFMSLIEEVSLKDVKKRLIKFLLDMLDKNIQQSKSKEALFVPFTREEIAQRLGTSRETVARYLSQLKKEKLIDTKPYQIIILDREKLKALI